MTDPDGQTVSYSYDDAKRVTGVQTQANGKSYKNTYTYQNGRIEKVAHNTTGELGAAVEYVPYTYGDANWKDKLTAYNGVPITYDAIGSPPVDRNSD